MAATGQSNESLIQFHAEDTDFRLSVPELIAIWLEGVAAHYSYSIGALHIIFCSDNYLHKLNVDYLQHDTLTDIITFPYSPAEAPIIADVFISIDRVRSNALDLGLSENRELQRIMVHGLLHLCGFDDKNPEEKAQMTRAEDHALELFDKIS